MPIIAYLCSKCNKVEKKFFRLVPKAPASFVCECGGELKRQLSAPTTTSKITIDNGSQARAVEVLPNIVELNEERANKDYREKE